MEAFQKIVGQTYCPYAKAAKIWYGPLWDMGATYFKNIESHVIGLRQFVQVAKAQCYHGFVSEIVIGPEARDFGAVKRAFRQYLYSLASTDSSCRRCMEEVCSDKYWQFEYADVRMFLNVFAPCYEVLHSKRAEVDDRFFVFSSLNTRSICAGSLHKIGLPRPGSDQRSPKPACLTTALRLTPVLKPNLYVSAQYL